MGQLNRTEIFSRCILLLVSILWGTTFVVISSTKHFFPPAFLVFLRCLLGAGVISLLCAKKLRYFSFKYIIAGNGIGFLMACGFLLQGVAISHFDCPPGRCGFLVATYCVMTPFVTWVIDKKPPNRYNGIAAILCLIGILCISLPDLVQSANAALNVGDLAALLSGLAFAVYLVYMGRVVTVLDPVLFTIVHLFIASFYIGIYSFLFEDLSQVVWNVPSISAALYLGVICMAVTNTLQAIGQKNTPASTTALIFSLESVFGIITAIIFWQEKVTGMLLIGCLLIFFAITISETELHFLKKYLSREVLKKWSHRL